MYPGSWVTTFAALALLGIADGTTGRNCGASGVWQAMLCVPNLPARYSRRHLNTMLVLSPWRSASFATDMSGSQASMASRRLNAFV